MTSRSLKEPDPGTFKELDLQVQRLMSEHCATCPAGLQCLRGVHLAFCEKCGCCHWTVASGADERGIPFIDGGGVFVNPKALTYHVKCPIRAFVFRWYQTASSGKYNAVVGDIGGLSRGGIVSRTIMFQDPISGERCVPVDCFKCAPGYRSSILKYRCVDLNAQRVEKLTPALGLADTLRSNVGRPKLPR